MNTNFYIDFHTYTEAKSEFILAEERKDNKMNKSSETNKSKDNNYGAAKYGNNKNKDSNQNKNYHQSNKNYRGDKNLSLKCTYYAQDGHFEIKCLKNPQGESYTVKPDNSTGSKNTSLMT